MEPDVQPEWRLGVGNGAIEGAHAGICGGDAERRSDGGQHERLGEKLPNDRAP